MLKVTEITAAQVASLESDTTNKLLAKYEFLAEHFRQDNVWIDDMQYLEIPSKKTAAQLLGIWLESHFVDKSQSQSAFRIIAQKTGHWRDEFGNWLFYPGSPISPPGNDYHLNPVAAVVAHSLGEFEIYQETIKVMQTNLEQLGVAENTLLWPTGVAYDDKNSYEHSTDSVFANLIHLCNSGRTTEARAAYESLQQTELYEADTHNWGNYFRTSDAKTISSTVHNEDTYPQLWDVLLLQKLGKYEFARERFNQIKQSEYSEYYESETGIWYHKNSHFFPDDVLILENLLDLLIELQFERAKPQESTTMSLELPLYSAI